MRDEVLAEMQSISLAQDMTLCFGDPMGLQLMVAFLPIARRMVSGELLANWPWDAVLSLPLRFIDVEEES